MKITHDFIENKDTLSLYPIGLIIGTFPSILIRKKFNKLKAGDVNFFYGSIDNYFWKDLGEIYKSKFQYNLTDSAVIERKNLLKDLRLEMTDIICECQSDGGVTDNVLSEHKLNEGVINILDDNKGIITIYFTSISGKLNAEQLTLSLLRKHKRILKMQIIQKQNPRIRQFLFKDNLGKLRLIRSIGLYSPSPLAKRGGVTDEKRIDQYKTHLPKISNRMSNFDLAKQKQLENLRGKIELDDEAFK